MAPPLVITFSVLPLVLTGRTLEQPPHRSPIRVVSAAPSHSPPHILDRVARGEPGAAEECVRRYADLVWSVARRLSGGALRADADDAVQEIFVDLWRSAGRFDPAVASEPAFVVMIARRRLIDRLRRATRRPPGAQFAEGAEQQIPSRAHAPDAAARLAQAEDAAVALRALDALAPEQQRCIRLAVHHGYTHTQVAEITGLPLGTVKTHVRRGLMRVREAIESKATASAGAGGRS